MIPTKHRSSLLSALALIVLCSALSLDITHAEPLKVENPDSFSYQAPDGWTIQKLSNGTSVAAEMKSGTIAAMIDVEIDKTPGPLRQWAENSVAKNKVQLAKFNPTFGDMTEFQTAAGAKGYKVPVTFALPDKTLHETMYIFAGSNDAKIVASCTSMPGSTVNYDLIFDTAMKTFVAK